MAGNYNQQYQQHPPQQPGYYPPQQHPPQQPGYYPPQQQGPPGPYMRPGPLAPQATYYQGGYGAPAGQQLVVQQPTPAPVLLGKVPASCTCPKCGAVIVTQTEHRVGSTTMTYCLILSCFCCCCIPFCTDCAKDVAHKCPNCGTELGVFRQPLVESGGGSGSRPKYDSTFHGPGDDGTTYGADDGGGGGDGGD